MAEVSTGADPLVMPLDCLEDVDHLVVAVLGAMVVDRDPDVELLDELVEALERFRRWVGRNAGDAGRLGELEHLPVGGGIATEAVDAVGAGGEPEVGKLLLHGGDRRSIGVHRKHVAVELDEPEADVAGVLHRLIDLVAAQRIELDAEVEIGGSCLPGEGGKGGDGGTSRSACGQEATAGERGGRHARSFFRWGMTREVWPPRAES